MIKEHSQLIHFRRARTNFPLCPRNVLAILPASRVRAVCRSHKPQGPPYSILLHLPQSLRQHRMPVAIPPIDWQPRPVSLQLRVQRGNQRPRLLVDRTLSLEVVIMLGHGQHALPRNVPPAQPVLEEGNHLFLPSRPTETNPPTAALVHSILPSFPQ